MGESVYRFVLREIPGAFVRGWRDEARRLAKAGRPVWSAQNEILQGFAISVTVAAALVAAFGPHVLPFILIHHGSAWFTLTLANYVEHYGLLREKKANGQYEPCRPHHSWNTNHIYSNLMTFQLQRHSDHHTYPMRPYQALRDFPDLPRLPSGYGGMFGLAMLPPLFFKVMDRRLMAWARGDLTRVNLHEPARRRLEAQWGAAREVHPST
jgi:alkane 1-monooxygenase